MPAHGIDTWAGLGRSSLICCALTPLIESRPGTILERGHFAAFERILTGATPVARSFISGSFPAACVLRPHDYTLSHEPDLNPISYSRIVMDGGRSGIVKLGDAPTR